jgi:hypothetical protein|tara:strand:+ start:4025 stop:4447 length:423 start_codon:yes stop_codon:yes gene_type:complete
MQSFEIKTLIDITQTGQTKFKSKDRMLINQQANWNTFFQVLSMRVNPEFGTWPAVEKCKVDDLGFGTKHKGQHNVWTFRLSIERDYALSEDTLKVDFDLVPVIKGLSETILNNNDAFRTTDVQAQNIVFKLVDNTDGPQV